MKKRQANLAYPLGVLLINDESIISEGIQSLLTHRAPFPINLSICSPQLGEVLTLYKTISFDIIIFTNAKKEAGYFQLIKELKHLHPELKFIVYGYNAKESRQISGLGVEAVLAASTSAQDFLAALSAIMNGQKYFSKFAGHLTSEKQELIARPNSFLRENHITPREVEVLRLIGKAHNTKEIAKALFISDQTVSVHRKNIMRKLGVRNTASLVRLAVEQRLI